MKIVISHISNLFFIGRGYRLYHWAEDDFEAKEAKELAESLTRGGKQCRGNRRWKNGISGRTSGWNGVPYLHTSPQRSVFMVHGIWGALCKYDLDAIWTSNYWKSWMFHQYNRDVSNYYTACFIHGERGVAHGPPRPDACLGLHPSFIVSVLNIYYLSILAAGFPFIDIYIYIQYIYIYV